MNTTLVAFDLDGTILDSEWAHEKAKARIIRELGAPVSIDFSYYTGRSNRLFFEEVLRQSRAKGDVEALVKRQFALVLEALQEAGQKESPGLTPLLSHLKDNGIHAAVCSGSDDYFVTGILRLLKIERYFDVIVTGSDASAFKPAPDIFLAAARKAGVDPAHAVAIEDSASGCLAAHAAGMRCVGYTNGGRNPQDLREADWIVGDLHEVAQLLS